MNLAAVLLALALAPALLAQGAEQCTSAVISRGQEGRPMLWKNRDTDTLSNKVVFRRDLPHSYLALVDADDDSGRHAWAGLNDAGFAIMNTVAYNLPGSDKEARDGEGAIMGDALRLCRTVADFEAWLEANKGRGLGSQANFGVLDAEGRAFLFEVHNHGFTKIDAALCPDRLQVNTNFARSGKPGKGAGYLRFDRASALVQALGPVTAQGIFAKVARDTGNPLTKQPSAVDLAPLPRAGQGLWVSTRDSINKSYTSASVIIVGRRPGDPGSRATFWILPGEPVTGLAMPLWVEAGRSPEPLWKGAEAPLWAETRRIKEIGRPFPEAERKEYLDLARLLNAEGTGYLPRLLAVEEEIFKAAAAFEARPRTPEELAAFQDAMAAKALGTLKRVGL
ncbi:hypothetical protein [Geothrix sp. 21YS21S-2]|uniref:hypothetical protein n=1 Tax=Geothrix sp. 21YS21S-2 TaxID=3068893 RepID=UPI0027BA3D24|nr:hypothetical protein [Geothrix sp. 21YS21S-2]